MDTDVLRAVRRLENRISQVGINLKSHEYMPLDGWIKVEAKCLYVGEAKATLSGNQTAILKKGTKLRWRQGAGFRYNYIAAKPTYNAGDDKTTIVLTQGYSETVGDGAFAEGVSDVSFSIVENPQGFPTAFCFNPNAQGFSGNADYARTPRFCIHNGLCYVSIFKIDGTSNSTTLTFTLPVAPLTESDMHGLGYCIDSGAFSPYAQPHIGVRGGELTATAYRGFWHVWWTNTGRKAMWLPDFSYMI